MAGRYTASEVAPKPTLWYPRLLLPNIAKLGEDESVAITFFVSPFANDASILMSSPTPVGMFLICNAAITEPPHLSVGLPLISENVFGPAAARPTKPEPTAGVKVGFRTL